MVEKTNKPFPAIHDLEVLLKLTGINLNKLQKKNLSIINTFNIADRYDDFKLSFYKNTTQTYAKKYLGITQKLLLWLKKQ